MNVMYEYETARQYLDVFIHVPTVPYHLYFHFES